MTTTGTERTEAMEALAQSFKGAFAAVRRLRGREPQRPGELRHAQYQVLFELLRAGEMSSGELATVVDVTPASITEMLDRLADAGLVERLRSEHDRRVVRISLTDAGRALCEERHAQIEPLWHEQLSQYTPDELRTAAAVLDSLGELFERMCES